MEHVQFSYLDCSYEGRGVLRWSPHRGGELDAFVNTNDPLPQKIVFGRGGPHAPDVIRMRTNRGQQRMRATVPLVDRFDLVEESRLNIRLPHLLMNSAGNSYIKPGTWNGRVVLRGLPEHTIMPDVMHTRRQFPGRRTFAKGWKRNALSFGDPTGATVRGEKTDDGHLVVHWNLKSRYGRLGRPRCWPEAFRDALSVLTGSELHIVQSEVETRTRTRLELVTRRDSTKLGDLSLVSEQLLSKSDLRLLTRFFYKGGPEALVARMMFGQLAEATRQRTRAGLELLTATILEAALRTLQDTPFVPGKSNKFDAKRALRAFRNTYLDSTWADVAADVLKAWKRLRHRNAHPEWLHAPSKPGDWYQAAYHDLMLLSRFYGAMILAMAGKEDTPKPIVPDLSKRSILTITRK